MGGAGGGGGGFDLHTTVKFALALASASAFSFAASIAAFSLACLSASSIVPAQAEPLPVTDDVIVVPFSHIMKTFKLAVAVVQTSGEVVVGPVGKSQHGLILSQPATLTPTIKTNIAARIFILSSFLFLVKVLPMYPYKM